MFAQEPHSKLVRAQHFADKKIISAIVIKFYCAPAYDKSSNPCRQNYDVFDGLNTASATRATCSNAFLSDLSLAIALMP